MNKKIPAIFFLLLFSLIVDAQTTGYMGKRGSIVFSSYYSPSMSLPFSKKYNVEPTRSLSLNYVVSRKKELSVSVLYSHGKVDNFPSNQGYYGNSRNFFSDNKFSKVSSIGISLAIKAYRNSGFAPLGPYCKWEAIVYSTSVKIDPYHYSNSYDSMDNPGGTRKFYNFGGGFSFGKQRVFFDKMILDIGIRGAIVMGFSNYTVDTYSERDILALASENLLVNSLLNLRVGIGFLAF